MNTPLKYLYIPIVALVFVPGVALHLVGFALSTLCSMCFAGVRTGWKPLR